VIEYSQGMDYNNVVTSMLHGVDIALVDPQIYPYLVSPIYIFIDSYRAQHDDDMVKKLEFFLKYIEEQPRKQEIAAILSKTFPDPPPKPPALTEDEVRTIVDGILQTEDIKYFNADELDLIIAEIRKRRADYIKAGDYLGAQRCEHFTRAIMNYGQLGTVEQMQVSKADEIKIKLDEARNSLNEMKAKWELMYTNLRKEAKNDLISINSLFEKSISDLEKLYEEKPQSSFDKPSNELLQLRSKQTAMVASKRYAEAAKIKDEADNLEKAEREQRIEKWKQSIDHRISTKVKEQERTVLARKDYWKREEAAMVSQANKEVEKAEKAIAHLEKSLNNATQAHQLAKNLKEETKNVPNAVLPPLKSTDKTVDALAFRQRAILNAQIYTRPNVHPQSKK